MIFSVTGIELFFLDYQVFLAQTKKASVVFKKMSCAILFSSCILVRLKFTAG
jgi:hypothetical protein